MTNPLKHSGTWLMAKIFFILASLGAAYLLYTALKNGHVAGCGSGSSCETVLKTRWAYFLPGVPVTVPALLTYLVLLYGMFFKPRSELFLGVFLAGGLVVIGAAVWFTGAQMFVIKRFCFYCLGVHAMGVAGAICMLASLRPMPRELKPFGVGVAALALGVLAAFQFFLPQRSTANTVFSENGLGAGQVVNVGGIELNLAYMPYYGNPDSEKRLLVLFDYTCTSCRRVHDYLKRAEERYGRDNYLVVMMPMPLNPECNRYYPHKQVEHRNSCLFASMAFALWSIDVKKFEEYDRWMIETGSARFPPDADAARAKAEELVGKEKLDKALAEAGVDQKIELCTRIWNAMKEKTGRDAMPKMLWSNGTLTDGAADSEFELFSAMEAQLNLKRLQ